MDKYYYEAAEWGKNGKLKVYNTGNSADGYVEFDDLAGYKASYDNPKYEQEHEKTNYIAIK